MGEHDSRLIDGRVDLDQGLLGGSGGRAGAGGLGDLLGGLLGGGKALTCPGRPVPSPG